MTDVPAETPAPTTALVLGVWSLARLADLPRSRVLKAVERGRLRTVTSDGMRGMACRYVVVDGRLDGWVARQRERLGPVPLDELDVPRTNGGFPWFYPNDVRGAARAGLVDVDGRDRLTVDGRFLRWAASKMPRGERSAVLGSIVANVEA